MFIGHFAPACVAATHRKAPSLPILFLGAQLIDWAFFGLLYLGVEKARLVPGISAMNPMDLYSMPYTHSLLGTLAWAAGFAVLIRVFGKSWVAAAIGFGVVVSHWVLDLLVHIPDLTLAGQPPKLGFGLWNHPLLEMPLELGMTALGLWLYARATGGLRPSIWALAVILLVLQAINWFGPQPAEVTLSVTLLAWFGYAVATLGAWWAARTAQRRHPAH
jgi:membrane protein DedA with SNARE-associated domain